MRGRVCFITGSNRGIGRAMAEEFARNGADLIAHARLKTDAFEADMSGIADKYGVSVTPVYFDMTDSEAMKEVFRELYKNKTKIDILINNAGVAHGGLFGMTPVSKIKEVFEINLFSVMELTQLVLKIMTRQKSGCIVNLASIAGIDLKPGNSAYGVSKAAVIAWTKTLASEVAQYGIRVNAIAPGLTDTNMASLMEDKAGKEMIESSAMKRLAKPEEIAKVALFLASENASFVNGQVIRVDGGAA